MSCSPGISTRHVLVPRDQHQACPDPQGSAPTQACPDPLGSAPTQACPAPLGSAPDMSCSPGISTHPGMSCSPGISTQACPDPQGSTPRHVLIPRDQHQPCPGPLESAPRHVLLPWDQHQACPDPQGSAPRHVLIPWDQHPGMSWSPGINTSHVLVSWDQLPDMSCCPGISTQACPAALGSAPRHVLLPWDQVLSQRHQTPQGFPCSHKHPAWISPILLPMSLWKAGGRRQSLSSQSLWGDVGSVVPPAAAWDAGAWSCCAGQEPGAGPWWWGQPGALGSSLKAISVWLLLVVISECSSHAGPSLLWVLESWNGLGWEGPSRPSHSMGRDTLQCPRLPQALSSLAWDTARGVPLLPFPCPGWDSPSTVGRAGGSCRSL
ncbi:uncharacterized protein LOC131093756 isoform X1 [Melospiza georgiana]|uniref:uncharacterized protein LOC131093756 isoform X1 n=1 Tax=Melospiza georgiana TaxID=44398 RepID=UPI0025AD2BAE|nr:uncharacterized protein LOC131093756 isoform X1 [Melospiza georgiana]